MTEETMEENVIANAVDKPAQDITPVDISEEMRRSYLDYAMSVIVSRALPDVRDGLKPVHRRIIYLMFENGYDYNRPFRKSARIVGDVLGKYHPHGDSVTISGMNKTGTYSDQILGCIEIGGRYGFTDALSAYAWANYTFGSSYDAYALGASFNYAW